LQRLKMESSLNGQLIVQTITRFAATFTNCLQ
jgi:hypothetical protein